MNIVNGLGTMEQKSKSAEESSSQDHHEASAIEEFNKLALELSASIDKTASADPLIRYRDSTFLLVTANDFTRLRVRYFEETKNVQCKLRDTYPLPNLPSSCKGSVYGLYVSEQSLLQREDGWYKYKKENNSWSKYLSSRQDAFNLHPVEIDGYIMCIVGKQSIVELTKIKDNALDNMQMSWTKCRTDLPRRTGPPIFPCALIKTGPNTIFLHGGFDDMTSSPWTFLTQMHEGRLLPNRKKIVWKQLPSSSTPRGFHLSFKLDTKFVIAGGIADDNTHLTSSEIYDIDQQTWTSGPEMPFNPLGLGAEGTMIVPFLLRDIHEKFVLILGWVEEEPSSMKVIQFTLNDGFKQLKDIKVRRPPLSQHIIAIPTLGSKESKVEEASKVRPKIKTEAATKINKEALEADMLISNYGGGKRAK